MKVKDLINKLKELDQELDIVTNIEDDIVEESYIDIELITIATPKETQSPLKPTLKILSKFIDEFEKDYNIERAIVITVI